LKFKRFALLIAVVTFCGCISEKKSEETIYTTEEAIGSYIVKLNTTTQIETDINSNNSQMTLFTPQKEKVLSLGVFDIGKGNESFSVLEKVIHKLEWGFNWIDAGAGYMFMSKTEINGQQGIIVTGNSMYGADEVLAAYYPLPGTMIVAHSTFTKQETWDILNTTVVKLNVSQAAGV
jgi:hypothetical protein